MTEDKDDAGRGMLVDEDVSEENREAMAKGDGRHDSGEAAHRLVSRLTRMWRNMYHKRGCTVGYGN